MTLIGMHSPMQLMHPNYGHVTTCTLVHVQCAHIHIHVHVRYLVIMDVLKTTDNVKAFGYTRAMIYLLYDPIKTVDLEGGEGRQERKGREGGREKGRG